MLLLTDQATLICAHGTRVENKPSQSWVTIEGRPVLIEPDPVGRSISNCPNKGGAGLIPCTATVNVRTGYSTLVRIGSHAACLETVVGATNGGVAPFEYRVIAPGQSLVTERA